MRRRKVLNGGYELDELYWLWIKARRISKTSWTVRHGRKKYATDGYLGSLDVIFPGKHARNVHNKNDTHNVESINADLRHYIPVLRRRSRCFCRKLETLQTVIEVFVDAYNKFGPAKLNGRVPTLHETESQKRHSHPFREVRFSVLDFL